MFGKEWRHDHKNFTERKVILWQKQAFSRKSAKESITRNQAFVVKRNLKLPENVSIINVQKIPGDLFCRGFLYL